MGMFDKDKEIGRQLTAEFKEGEEFVLYAVKVEEAAVQTDFGMADKTRMVVQRRESNGPGLIGNPFEVTTIGGAIANKAREAEPGDFPALVKWLKVPTKLQDATVVQFVGPFEGQNRASEVWPTAS